MSQPSKRLYDITQKERSDNTSVGQKEHNASNERYEQHSRKPKNSHNRKSGSESDGIRRANKRGGNRGNSATSREGEIRDMATNDRKSTPTSVGSPNQDRNSSGSSTHRPKFTKTNPYIGGSFDSRIASLCLDSQRDAENDYNERDSELRSDTEKYSRDSSGSSTTTYDHSTESQGTGIGIRNSTNISENVNSEKTLDLQYLGQFTCASVVYQNRRFLFNPILDLPIIGESETTERTSFCMVVDSTIGIYAYAENQVELIKEIAECVAFLVDTYNVQSPEYSTFSKQAQELSTRLLLRITEVNNNIIGDTL